MSVKKLYFLPAGRCLVDGSALNTRSPQGKMENLPIWSYLIDTTDGPILVDTGMPESCILDPNGYFAGTEDEGLIIPKMKEDDHILSVLARTGYHPEDLLCVVSTHLHFDHAGGNRHFSSKPIVLQRAEYQAASTQDNYFAECKDPSLQYQLVDGDYELVPGVQLLFTPGHTPGHQSLLISTSGSGPVLLTIDAAYTQANFEEFVPFAVSDRDRANHSIQRLREIAREEKATVFYGHDIRQGESWRKYPEFL